MLSFNEIFLFAPQIIWLFIIGLGMVLLSLGMIFYHNTENPFSLSLFLVVGVAFIFLSGLSMYNGEIHHATLTPCNIIAGADQYYISEENSDTIYRANMETMLKIHLNQPIGNDHIHLYGNDKPYILKVYSNSSCASITC